MTPAGFLLDVTGCRSKAKWGYSWAHKGTDRVVSRSVARTRVNKSAIPRHTPTFSKWLFLSWAPPVFPNLLIGYQGSLKGTVINKRLSNCCCWKEIQAGDFLYCYLVDVTSHFWVYSSVVFTVFTLLYNRHLKHFLSCKTETLCLLRNSSHLDLFIPRFFF